MNPNTLPDARPWQGMVPLPELVPVRLSGADAVTFLHSQITQDVQKLPEGQWRLGGHCSAKGRLQASFELWRPAEDTVMLLAHASLLPAWLKRLQMFVMRSKVSVADLRAELAVHGVLGEPTLRQLTGLDTLPTPDQITPCHGGHVLHLPTVQGVARGLWVGPAGQALPAPVAPAAPAEQPATAEQWAWLDVMSGVPRITQATAEQFVPQMVNFEVVGGVNFQKGCYPGQEVVARSQYRGTVKRRLFVAHVEDAADISPMQDVFAATEPEQPAGAVVNVARVPGQAGCSALIELKLSHAQGSSLHAGSATGPTLNLGELPYPMPTDTDA